jgi:transcriptional regulator with XRE-family HTH domain
VVERSPFGVRLWRLLERRRPTVVTKVEQMVASLAQQAGVSSSSLDELLNGVEPSSDVLRLLAPALGIHAADMFVVAGLRVPQDLASAWPTLPWDVGSVLEHAVRLQTSQVGELDELIRSLPINERTDLAPDDDYPEGPAALLLRLQRNRNIRPYRAKVLAEVGGGPYVSAATVAGLGTGHVVLTPQYVTAFAHVLGYAPEDVVALAGVGPVFADARVHPASVELAQLAWNARRLTSDQLSHVLQVAHGMRRAEPT